MSSSLTSSTVIKKQPSEVIRASMDFSEWLDDAVVISNPIVQANFYGCEEADLEFSNIEIDGHFVKMFIAGGTDGNRYRVNIRVETDCGELLEGDGILEVSNR